MSIICKFSELVWKSYLANQTNSILGYCYNCYCSGYQLSHGYQLRNFSLPDIQQNIQTIVRPLAISIGSVYTSVFLLRHFLKYFYFSYKGYLKENPKKPSFFTILWGILRKAVLTIAPPQLSSCDRLLPNIPLPALKNTVKQYVDSMQLVLSEVSFQ